MRNRLLSVLRLCFGLLVTVALTVQAHHVATQDASLVNFFSYFTNLSNIAGAAVLLAGGTLGLLNRGRLPDLLRGAVVLYLVVTGLIYLIALSGYELGLLLPWVNTVLHRVMPLVLLADWLVDPPRRPIGRRRVLPWLVFPLLYLTYTLIRGAITDWYPYPFLEPDRRDGYGRVGVACTMVALAFLAIAEAIVWAGNRLAPSRTLSPGPRTLARHRS